MEQYAREDTYGLGREGGERSRERSRSRDRDTTTWNNQEQITDSTQGVTTTSSSGQDGETSEKAGFDLYVTNLSFDVSRWDN